MNGSGSVTLSKNKPRAAKKHSGEIDEIETAEIMANKSFLGSIRRSEKDLLAGRFTRISSRKELVEFFKK